MTENDLNESAKRSKGSSPSILAISVIVGALTSSATAGLPGGLSGSAGFLIGLTVSFIAGSALVIYASGRRPYQTDNDEAVLTAAHTAQESGNVQADAAREQQASSGAEIEYVKEEKKEKAKGQKAIGRRARGQDDKRGMEAGR